VQEETFPVFPVSAWQIGPVPSYGIVVVRFAFLAHSLQKLDEAEWGRRYALQPNKVRELIQELERSLRHLESAAPQAPPGQRQ
jgi:biofilm regulator BssS